MSQSPNNIMKEQTDLLRESPDLVLVELPYLEQGVLCALVLRGLEKAAVDLRRKFALLRVESSGPSNSIGVE